MQTAPPTVPGMPAANSRPVSRLFDGKGEELGQGRAGFGTDHGKGAADGAVFPLDPDRVHALQADHHAAEPAVPDQQVRAAAEDEVRELPAS